MVAGFRSELSSISGIFKELISLAPRRANRPETQGSSSPTEPLVAAAEEECQRNRATAKTKVTTFRLTSDTSEHILLATSPAHPPFAGF